MLATFALSHALGFALALARAAGFVVTSPFPGANVSHTQRVGLAAVLAWVVSTFAPLASVPETLDLRLAGTVATEIGCGLLIGVAFRLLYLAAEVLGHVVSQAIGLSMASVMNPAISSEDVALSRVVTLLAEFLALGAGVHRIAIAYLLRSFRALPVGGSLALTGAVGPLVDLFVRSFALGVQLATPVVGVCLVVHIGLALIARAAPALQILHVGLGALLGIGFLTLVRILPDLGGALTEYYGSLGRILDVLLTLVAPRAR
jgi:flagellar biosynthetic protein FliR